MHFYLFDYYFEMRSRNSNAWAWLTHTNAWQARHARTQTDRGQVSSAGPGMSTKMVPRLARLAPRLSAALVRYLFAYVIFS